MKHLLKLLIILVIIPAACMAQTDRETGMAFINTVFKKDYSKAMTYMADTLSKQLTPDLMEKTFTSVQGQLGAYQKNLDVNEEDGAEHKTLYYYSKFENKDLDIKLVFDQQHKIMGFFITPHKDFEKKKTG